ncbi:MAG: N-acetyltransferase [Thermoplasmata archaeon]|nr:N-acetyltransferase [Thermoplasmata archaeon]
MDRKEPSGKERGKDSLKAEGVIRKAEPSDFEDVMNIENACFPGELAYSRQQMRYLLFKANGVTLVEVRDGRAAGYITAVFRRGSEIAGIETIGVDPRCRGSGIGARLLRAAEEWMKPWGIKSFRLEVSIGNEQAISMYEKAGYRITETIDNYYIYEHHGTRSVYRMEKDL